MRRTRICFPFRFCAILLFAASSCGNPAETATPSARTPAKEPAPIIEFAVEPLAGEGVEITRYHHGDSDLDLGPRRSFSIVAATLAADENGYPALSFEIAKEERAEFQSWTASHVGKQLALFVDGRLVIAPVIQSELPAGGILSFGAEPWTEKQVQDLANRVLAQSARPGR